MKLKAYTTEIGDDNIKWLIIESDEVDTKGFFIYYHLNNEIAYDTWHKSIDEAFDAAYQQYGITKEQWEKSENDIQ
jgi:hypothetical protein